MFELLWKTECRHDKITPNMMAGYCPDCGEFVRNQWYITRCKCCGIKQKSVVKNDTVTCESHYCRNCGSSSFEVEALESLDIVNIHYAVVKKETRKEKKPNIIQTWIEENAPVKLLPSY